MARKLSRVAIVLLGIGILFFVSATVWLLTGNLDLYYTLVLASFATLATSLLEQIAYTRHEELKKLIWALSGK